MTMFLANLCPGLCVLIKDGIEMAMKSSSGGI